MINNEPINQPSFKEAVKFWFRLGWISFGGTAGHIAIMHDFLVSQKKWIDDSRFFHALSLCMLLPGPEAQQLAIYIGQQLHGRRGGIAAGVLFVLPSMFILLGLSIVYVLFGQVAWIIAAFSGLKPAVIAIIVVAVSGIAKKSLDGSLHYAVALTAFTLLAFEDLPVIYVIAGTIVMAIFICVIFPEKFNRADVHLPGRKEESDLAITGYQRGKDNRVATWSGIAAQSGIFLLLWCAPLAVIFLLFPDYNFWQTLILSFTKAALFTVGGSYTVLPFVAQFAVSRHQWLSRLQMVDGFALAETTPGPLIIVVGFVGFLAGYQHFQSSIWFGTMALFLTVYYTFLPCFFYIFTGAPLIERSHGNNLLRNILKLVTAAVVGIILNLTLFLGKSVMFNGTARIDHINLFSLLWGITAAGLIIFKRTKIPYLIVLSLILGLGRYFWVQIFR